MQDAPAVPREERPPHLNCPACGMISEPDSADHRRRLDRAHDRWAHGAR
jgi:hypothetical protein